MKRRNSTTDNNRKKKLTVEPKSSLKNRITHFEDLPNELIYEIFDFLDFCQLYDIFFNLNVRFQNLLTDSTLANRIKILFASKSSFQRYYNQIIIPNQHQIKSLHLSNPFIIEHIFSPVPITLKLIQLERLILNQIESTYIENLLDYLLNSPNLSSLVLICEDLTINKNKFYNQIFRLPALKYCKLSFKKSDQFEFLPISMNQFSPIEHFVLVNIYPINDLDVFLSSMPHLNRLSIHFPYNCLIRQMRINSIASIYLTHVSLNGPDIPFNQFELMIHYLFHQVQVLHISTRYGEEYLNANRWQNLIVDNMPHLRVFDIFFSYILHDNESIVDYINRMNQFDSSFWSERQWFFEYHVLNDEDRNHLRFYSTNPYRKKQYTLYETRDSNIDLNSKKVIMNSVHQVEIRNEKTMNDCRKYFPNTTQLTIVGSSFEQYTNLLSTSLRNIIPLIQLTTFVYRTFKYDFSKIIELFQYTPNIHTFEIGCSSLESSDLVSIQQTDTFRSVSRTNTIRNMIIGYGYTLQEIMFLINLCPRLYQLSIDKFNSDFQTFLRCLLLNDHKKLNYLSLLCITYMFPEETERLKTFIKSEKLLWKYSVKYDRCNNSMYLWG